MTTPPIDARFRLDDLGVLAARGADVRAFLQGQLSQDVAQITADRSPLAGFHNPQGRTIAILRLVADGPVDVLCVTQKSLISAVRVRLQRVVLRAKLTLADESDRWSCWGLVPAVATSGADGAAIPHAVASRVWRHGSTGRLIALQPAAQAPPEAGRSGDDVDWELADIRDGLPEINAATSELFVAQMLNLDRLEAVSFQKGCYAGQEVIARAHYRGRVKRRLQRFTAPSVTNAPPAPGTNVTLPDGRSARIVRSARDPSTGSLELLAVAPLPGLSADSAATSDDAKETGAAPKLAGATNLLLPYSLES